MLIQAGHLGFAVLQCSSKSCFQVILTIKIIYHWARPIQKPAPSQITKQKYAFLIIENIEKNYVHSSMLPFH